MPTYSYAVCVHACVCVVCVAFVCVAFVCMCGVCVRAFVCVCVQALHHWLLKLGDCAVIQLLQYKQ